MGAIQWRCIPALLGVFCSCLALPLEATDYDAFIGAFSAFADEYGDLLSTDALRGA